MTYFRINEQVINNCISKLKLSKCPGPVEISSRILKMAVDSTSKSLNLMFKRSLLHREIPRDWKNANVFPIFKKGSKVEKNKL